MFIKASSNQTKLGGAVFGVYSNENVETMLSARKARSQENGTVNLGSFPLSNYMNGEKISKISDYRVYWLVETIAPKGYEIMPEAVAFFLLEDGMYRVVFDNDSVPVKIGDKIETVTNVQTNHTIPVTGGAGAPILLSVLFGLSLIGFTAISKRISNKNNT